MFVDSTLKFAQNLNIAAAAGTALVGDVIDLGNAPADFGDVSRPMYLIIQMTEGVVSAGAATLQFIIATDAQPAIATNGTATQHVLTGIMPKTALTKGTQLVLQLPYTPPAYERYLGLLVVTGTATTTTAEINAFLTVDPQTWKAYPEGNN